MVGPRGEVIAEAKSAMIQARMGLRLAHDGARGHRDAWCEHASRTIMVLALTEAPVLVEGGGSAEHLPAVLALDLGAAVCMHPLVAAQVGKLGIGLVTHLTWENTHA